MADFEAEPQSRVTFWLWLVFDMVAVLKTGGSTKKVRHAGLLTVLTLLLGTV